MHKIQNFMSLGAMKLFLWSFENRRFCEDISISHIIKNLGYGSLNVAIFKIVGIYIQDKIFNIQVCTFNMQDE